MGIFAQTESEIFGVINRDGLRVVKQAKGSTTHYIFEGTEVIYEKRLSNKRARSYVFSLGKHLDPTRQKNAVKYGGGKPIIVDKNGNVLDGHHRLNDAIQNGRAVDVQIGY